MDYLIIYKRWDSVVETCDDATEVEANHAFARYCCEHGDYALEFHSLVAFDDTDFSVVQPQPPAQVTLSSGRELFWWRDRIYCEETIRDLYDKFDWQVLLSLL